MNAGMDETRGLRRSSQGERALHAMHSTEDGVKQESLPTVLDNPASPNEPTQNWRKPMPVSRLHDIAARANNLHKSDKAEYRILCELPAVASPLPTRFLRKVFFRADGCWEWLGGTKSLVYKDRKYSYGVYSVYGTPQSATGAHQYSYFIHKGPVPEGMEIDHLCHNKLCVNPAHLEAVTHRENCRRRRQSGPKSGFKWVFVDGRRAFMRRDA